ncbi:trichothecene 3-o-acetyltransferase [Fusarium tjaetaba]|uniref:Trichothecene 3-o-acetyltransferase n=1 Tax=Fusarium tjaetaba TaxID=1567544 RepID=A0A8H5R2M2_9HYPO|nr:trichothecene 3-o-acetyltransferase [Fusarium tjaetaba]KAF5625409.1 trichothecene 3-o-acetyltransferase [Fusarium tjaetaba]
MADLDMNTKIVPLTDRVYLGEYHNLCFVFHGKTSFSRSVFISRVHKGLVRLSREFPWISGQVQHDGLTDQGANKYKIIPFQVIPRFQIDNLPDIPVFDFSHKEDEDWPMGWINENHVPIQEPNEPWAESKPSPVMELKLTLDPSTSILTISMNTKVVDRTGLIMMVRILAEACGGKIKNRKLPSSDILTTEKHAAFFNNGKKSLRHDRVPIRLVFLSVRFKVPSFISSPSSLAQKEVQYSTGHKGSKG